MLTFMGSFSFPLRSSAQCEEGSGSCGGGIGHEQDLAVCA